MAARKKKAAKSATANESVHAAELVELEAEIVECRAALNDAIGRYNYALDAAKVAG